jgi:hypothetical protein
MNFLGYSSLQHLEFFVFVFQEMCKCSEVCFPGVCTVTKDSMVSVICFISIYSTLCFGFTKTVIAWLVSKTKVVGIETVVSGSVDVI